MKVYSVQMRRYGSWLVCSGAEARKSYRVVALTTDYEHAKLMAALKCVHAPTVKACEDLANATVVPDAPVDYTQG